MELCETVHGFVELQERVGLLVSGNVRVLERDAPPCSTALQCALRLGSIDEHVAHGNRRDGKKMGAIMPVRSRLIDQLEVGLVNEGGRRERAAGCPGGELAVGNDAQLIVDERDELIERGLFSAAQLGQHIRAGFVDVVFCHGLSLVGLAEPTRVCPNMRRQFGERNVPLFHRSQEATMAKFTEIVVHFEVDNKKRRAIIKPQNELPVRAIFLDNSHTQLQGSIKKRSEHPPEDSVRLVDEDGATVAMINEDGPQVCYLVGGQLFCW